MPFTGLFDSGLPLVIAHRGASGDAPENTMAAFELAVDQGADVVELDVHLTLDGHPIVFHDDLLDRTTNAKGLVRGKTLAQLYDPDKMPKGLRQAHQGLDAAVERCYRPQGFQNDTQRLEYLFKE